MRHRYALAVSAIVCLGLTTHALAAPTPQPSPKQLLPVEVTGPLELIQIGEEHAEDCMLVYASQDPAPTSYYSAGAFVEVADDLHTILLEPEALCAVDIGYYSPSGPTDILVSFYDNNAADDPPVALTAGPFVVPGAPGGIQAVHVEFPLGIVTPNTWMGVTFTNASAGLLVSQFPTVGTSHDYHYETPPGGYFFLGGNPIANYWLGVYTSPAVQTENATWGQVKAIYR